MPSIILGIVLLLANIVPSTYSYSQGEFCSTFCVVAAQCNNQCNDSTIDTYSPCVCQPSCLCSISFCQWCCIASNNAQPFCISNSFNNCWFCHNYKGLVADPRCWPNSNFDFNASLPTNTSEFLQRVPLPSEVYGGFNPTYANIATKLTTFSTSFASTWTSVTATVYRAPPSSAIMRSETSTPTPTSVSSTVATTRTSTSMNPSDIATKAPTSKGISLGEQCKKIGRWRALAVAMMIGGTFVA